MEQSWKKKKFGAKIRKKNRLFRPGSEEKLWEEYLWVRGPTRRKGDQVRGVLLTRAPWGRWWVCQQTYAEIKKTPGKIYFSYALRENEVLVTLGRKMLKKWGRGKSSLKLKLANVT